MRMGVKTGSLCAGVPSFCEIQELLHVSFVSSNMPTGSWHGRSWFLVAAEEEVLWNR
jgi:hypothetical protein